MTAPPAGDASPTQAAPRAFAVYIAYATERRATEVANSYRSLGYNALASRDDEGYYVKVW